MAPPQLAADRSIEKIASVFPLRVHHLQKEVQNNYDMQIMPTVHDCSNAIFLFKFFFFFGGGITIVNDNGTLICQNFLSPYYLRAVVRVLQRIL